MISSVLVMLVLQVLWLHAVYVDYKNSLRQETSLLFSNTVTEMIDSLVWKGLTPLGLPFVPNLDSLELPRRRRMVMKQVGPQNEIREILDTIKIQISRDSTFGFRADSASSRMIRIISSEVNFEADSIKRILRPIIQGTDSLPGQRFEFNFSRELIDKKNLTEVFNEKLIDQGYELEAHIYQVSFNEQLSFNEAKLDTVQGRMILDEVNMPFGIRYFAYFDGYKHFLWIKMIPPILFAVLVLALIIVSFIVLYSNILRQQRLNLLKNDLISNITHELKTPIATVGVVLEALENFGVDQDSQSRQEYIQIAKKELQRLTTMSESILSSAVYGKQHAYKEPLAFDQLLEEQIQSFKPILKVKRFLFEYKKEIGDYKVYGNQDQLTLMIFNLLDNAVKYSLNTKAIKVGLSSKGGRIIFEVQDQGLGIEEEFQQDIFEKFVRVPQQDIHDVKGYGLGLAQVYSAVKNHLGYIHLKSSLGKGSLFTIEIPQHD